MAEDATPSIRWAVDRCDDTQVSGWAFDPASTDPLLLELLVDGHSIGSVRASDFRPDLSSMRCDGEFAFNLALTSSSEGEVLSSQELLFAGSEMSLRIHAGSGADFTEVPLLIEGRRTDGFRGLRHPSGAPLSLVKGRLSVALKDRDQDWIDSVIRLAKQFADDAAAAGFSVSLAYGSLLAAVRSGSVIKHDDDVDLMFIASGPSMLDAVSEFRGLQEFMVNLGYDICEVSNGQFWLMNGSDIGVDVFLAWQNRGALRLNFAVYEGVSVSSVLPLGMLPLEGVVFPSPREPSEMLKRIYGPNWEEPDPAFKWKLSSSVKAFFRPMHNYDRTRNLRHWETFYSDLGTRTGPGTIGIQEPSPFAVSLIGKLPQDAMILDIGCGNGRDARFFSDRGFDVLAVDYALPGVVADEGEPIGRLNFMTVDISSLASIGTLVDTTRRRQHGRPIAIYARFLLHAVDEPTEDCFLILVQALMRTAQDAAYLEFRTKNDAESEKAFGEHFRRFINTPEFIEKVENQFGLGVELLAEGQGLAGYGSEDPFVARVAISLRHGWGREVQKWTASRCP